MPGNNFIDNEIKSGLNDAGGDNQPEIKWTDPVSDKTTIAPKDAKGFFDLFKNTDDKKIVDSRLSENVNDFENKKRILHEYDGAIKEEKKKRTKDLKKEERPWTLKTNLVKEEVTTFVNWQRNIALLLIGLIFAVLIIGGAYAYLVFEEYRTEKEEGVLNTEIQALEEQISQAKKNIAIADEFQKKLNLTAALLDKHVYWSEFFKFIEENTLVGTYYSSPFTGDSQGVFSFSVTAKSYQDVDDQLRVFRANKLVLNAVVSSASLEASGEDTSGGQIKYDLELTLSPDVFIKK